MHGPNRAEDAQGDGQIEARALFAKIGRREVYGDPIVGEREARIANRRADALAALADGRIRQADRREHRQTGRHVHFDVNQNGFDAEQRRRQDTREHAAIVEAVLGAVNVPNRIRNRGAGRRAAGIPATRLL